MLKLPLAALRPTDPRPDVDLLAQFAAIGDEAGFAELVRRHGPTVWAVCRRLTPDRHAAEDAFQATFLVLLRRAGAVRRADSLAGFLHGVARKVSARCRRRSDESVADAAGGADPAAEASQREEAAALHAELDRLPARFREVLLLCDLAGLSRPEAAARLGWSEGSVKGRLERGRKLLATRLAKRGLAGGLVVAVAPPAELVASAGRSATAVWLGGPVPAGLAGLVRIGLPWGGDKLMAAGVAFGLVFVGLALARPADPPKAVPEPAAKPVTPPEVLAILREAAAALDAGPADAMTRTRFGSDLADLFRRAGDPASARDRLAEALVAADGFGDARLQDKYAEWRWPAGVYAKLGDTDAVLKLADAAPDKHAAADTTSPRDTILHDAVAGAVAAGRLDVAARLATAHSGANWQKSEAAGVRQIAVTLRAKTDLPAALKLADELPDPAERVAALCGTTVLNLWPTDLRDTRWWPGGAGQQFGVARTRHKFGDPAGGRQALARAVLLLPTVPPDRRPITDLGVIHSAAVLGDLATCRRLVAALPPDQSPARLKKYGLDGAAEAKAKGYLAAAEATAGDDAAGLKLADGLPTTQGKENVLLAVAVAQHRAGRKAEAVATFDRVADLWTAAEQTSYHNLISARCVVGDIAGAKAVAERELAQAVAQYKKSMPGQPEEWYRKLAADGGLTTTNIAYFQAKHGDIAGAKATLAERPSGGWRAGETAKWIAMYQVRAGRLADARKEAAGEPDLARRSHLLAGIAAGLLGDPD